MPDSSDIDTALLAKLNADATLLALLPNGWHWDEAPPGSTRFGIVSLVDAHDEPRFGSRSHEDAFYLVKAVGRKDVITEANIRAAAARINVLLDPQPPAAPATLTVAGYGLMTLQREERIRITEVDEVDPDIRWFHRGGHYRLVMSL